MRKKAGKRKSGTKLIKAFIYNADGTFTPEFVAVVRKVGIERRVEAKKKSKSDPKLVEQ